MKLIFSRKGFDSALGKVPSPILPDGRMVHLPIPSPISDVRYGDLCLDEFNLGRLVHDLSGGRISPGATAHLDPDLNPSSLARQPGWRPLFGQAGAAQGHLAKQGVAAGDIFLFFGWFQETDFLNGRVAFKKGAAGVHALFGWLQIERAVAMRSAADVPDWARYHPHAQQAQAFSSNTLYLSAEKLRLPGMGAISLPGAAVFRRFAPRLQLTKTGQKRSVWDLPGWCFPRDGQSPLTYHGRRDRWRRDRDRVTLRTVGRGQEFVLDTAVYPEALPWLRELLTSGFLAR